MNAENLALRLNSLSSVYTLYSGILENLSFSELLQCLLLNHANGFGCKTISQKERAARTKEGLVQECKRAERELMLVTHT